jgi:isopenicillin N synthase-like dioxygenase
MPSAISPEPPVLPRWKRPAKTTEDLPWADISIIDLSTFDEPGGKQKLAEELRHAVQTTGFFSVVGTGFTDEEVTRQFSIGQAFFDSSLEEKNKPQLRCDFGEGNYFGYRAVRLA